jgi:hypothetical protein
MFQFIELINKTYLLDEYSATGCGNAALKIYANASGRPTHELCGSNVTIANRTVQSTTNLMHIKYVYQLSLSVYYHYS